MFSEPGAGSDLAALRTRAVWQDESWLVNGQKVWTTGAHYSDYGLLLARTDADVPKHTGLTMFWIDMKAPGVEVRPIHQMSGGSDFNEVYLTDARVPDSQRLGDVGAGWKVALVTLMNERVEGGKDRGPTTAQILALARSMPRGSASVLDDPAFRQKLAMWYVQAEGLALHALANLDGPVPGADPRTGSVDRQAGGGQPSAGSHQRIDRMPGSVRPHRRRSACGPGRDVSTTIICTHRVCESPAAPTRY